MILLTWKLRDAESHRKREIITESFQDFVESQNFRSISRCSLNFLNYFFIIMGVLPICMFVYNIDKWYPCRHKEGTGVTDDCEQRGSGNQT